ncbi:MAG: FtsX-like permease family protein [Candidatus Heimdallarchaeota archaeon]|nr:FtsX-like permease family protein [Candidatus Heimdallarchaeota archaeon]
MSIQADQRLLNRKQKSYSLKLFMFSINLYLIFFLLNIRFFLNAGHVFAVIAVILIIDDINKLKQKSSRFQSNSSILDSISLAKKYLSINRVYLVAGVLGLIIATVVISQASLLTASYEQQVFDDFTKDLDLTGFRFTGDLREDESAYDDWLEYFDSFDSFLEEEGLEIESKQSQINLIVQLVSSQIFADDFGKSVYATDIGLSEYKQETYEDYDHLFDFDFNASETVLILKTWFKDYSSYVYANNSVNFIIGSTFVEADEQLNMINIPFDRVIYVEEEEDDGFGSIDIGSNLQSVLLTSQETINEIVEPYQDFLEIYPDGWSGLNKRFTSEVMLELPSLSDLDVENLRAKLEAINRKIYTWVESFASSHDYKVWVNVEMPLYYSIYLYQLQVQSLNAALFFVASPLIALAMFLVYFSLTLTEQRKQRILAILKMRGSSSQQLRVLMIEEVLLSGILSIIVGMTLSLPWTVITLQEILGIELFDFQLLSIPSDWFWKLPIIGIILSLDLNLPNISKLLEGTIEDSGEIFEQKKEPFWQKLKLDLIFFILSLSFWIFFRFYPQENLSLLSFVITGLSPFMLLIFFLGAPLVVARYFSTVIDYASEKIWRAQGGLFALATRNMKKNKYSASKLAALLLLAMMLSYLSIIVPGSFNNWNHERANYELGADIYIDGLDPSNITLWQMVDIPEVQAYTHVIKTSMAVPNSGLYQYVILGVDPTSFSEVAFWKENYATNTLADLMSQMTSNTSILMQEGIKRLNGIEIGDTMTFATGTDGTEVYNLDIQGEFTYFPNLVDEVPYEDPTYDYISAWKGHIVTKTSLALTMGDPTDMKSGAYVKVIVKADIAEVTSKLREMFKNYSDISIVNSVGIIEEIEDDPTISIIISSLSTMIILSVISSVIAVAYFSFITLAERKKEIGVFRAMGMVRGQIFLLLLIEGLTLVITASILGGLAGYFTSSNIFFFLSQMIGGGAITIPPVNLYLPWTKIQMLNGSMIGLTGLAAAIPANLTANKQTGSILRSE